MTQSVNQHLLEQVLQIGQQMNETRALDPLLVYAVDVSVELLQALYGFLVLSDVDDGLDFRVARDSDGRDVEQPEKQISRTIISRSLQEKKAIITASAVSDEQFRNAESVGMLGLKSVVCVPLISLGDAIGVIYLENRVESGLFSAQDAQTLMYLAGHAAVCIQNSILAEELNAVQQDCYDVLGESNHADETALDVVSQIVEEERSRLLQSFIRDTSHQFRTPLSIIRTSVDLLMRKLQGAQVDGYLERILIQVDTIVELVSSLNLLARLDMQRSHTMKVDDLVFAVRDIVEVMANHAMKQGITFSRHMPPYAIPVLMMQSDARQAISKVVMNAIMYSNEADHIAVHIIEDRDTVGVVVGDTGIGIAEEDLMYVTQRFFRVDDAGKTRGLGLGLSIAERIMAVHGGSLLIDSVLGEGTTVTLVFPKYKGDVL